MLGQAGLDQHPPGPAAHQPRGVRQQGQGLLSGAHPTGQQLLVEVDECDGVNLSAGLNRCSTASVPTSTSASGSAAGGSRDLADRPTGEGLELLASPGHSHPEEPQPGRTRTGADRRPLEVPQRGTGQQTRRCAIRLLDQGGSALLAAGQLSARGAGQQARPPRAVEHAHDPVLGPDERHQLLGVQAQSRIVVAPVDHLERRPAQSLGRAGRRDGREPAASNPTVGQALTTTHGTPPAGPARRPRSPHSRSGPVPGPSASSWPSMTITPARPGTRRPGRRPGPDDHGRAGSGLGPVVGDDRHLAARPAQPAGQDAASADRGHHHQRSARVWASSATSGVASADGGRRTITGRVDRERRRAERPAAVARWRTHGPAAGRTGTAARGVAVASRALRRPAHRHAAQAARSTTSGSGPSPGPCRWAGAAARGGSRRRRRPPSRRPAGRPGRRAPACPMRTSAARRPAPGSRTPCRRRPRR